MPGFRKQERLKSAERISEIYRKGTKLKQGFLLLYHQDSEVQQHRVAFAVPKRKVPSAVKRNAIKRKLREVYRLNKSALPDGIPPKDFILMFLGSEAPDYQKLERSYLKLCEKWGNSESV